ncbi:MAG: hypothetical protein VKL39_09540 [Leptolyngbyaceae bacterium]|nr:hypothetical protein [Leptolyngbyaceae bacterium]
MMKPDFSKMTRQELRQYVLSHREDDDAIAALIHRGNSNAVNYPFPEHEEDLEWMSELLQQKLKQQNSA